jgi:hypothetical protein
VCFFDLMGLVTVIFAGTFVSWGVCGLCYEDRKEDKGIEQGRRGRGGRLMGVSFVSGPRGASPMYGLMWRG